MKTNEDTTTNFKQGGVLVIKYRSCPQQQWDYELCLVVKSIPFQYIKKWIIKISINLLRIKHL